jgi:formimidoylglutamate deiminase
LVQQKRNVAAHCGPSTSSAANLLEAALAGGHAATAQPLGGLQIGNRADFVVLDSHACALLGVPADHVLDALVFSSPDAAPQAVFVGGKVVAHRTGAALASAFAQTMGALWQA